MKFFSQGLRSCSTLIAIVTIRWQVYGFSNIIHQWFLFASHLQKIFYFCLFNVYLCRYRGWRMKKWIVRIGLSMFLGVCHTNRLNIITKYAFWLPIYATWVLISPQRSLFRNKRLLLDEMTQRNASKFAIFYIYENLKLLFLFFISC